MAKTGTKASWKSRAVLRSIEAGSSAMCALCDEQVKFKAKVKAMQVICNVYDNGRWLRVEHYHASCYEIAGSPYGEPAPTTGATRVTAASVAASRATSAA